MSNKSRILIIDDEEIIRDVFKEILSDENYLVDVAEDYDDAQSYFKNGIYDVIYIDIVLPIKSGIQIAREYRKIDPAVSIILFTATPTPSVEQELEALHLSVFDFLSKPIPKSKLLKTTRKAINMKNRRSCLFDKKVLLEEADGIQDALFAKQQDMDNTILGGSVGGSDIQTMIENVAAERQEAQARLAIINSMIKESISKL